MINRKFFARSLSALGLAAFLSTATLGGFGVDMAQAATVYIQKTTIYVTTLPKGCVKTTYNGGKVVVWKCGTLYYQPYNGRYVRVYVKVE